MPRLLFSNALGVPELQIEFIHWKDTAAPQEKPATLLELVPQGVSQMPQPTDKTSSDP